MLPSLHLEARDIMLSSASLDSQRMMPFLLVILLIDSCFKARNLYDVDPLLNDFSTSNRGGLIEYQIAILMGGRLSKSRHSNAASTPTIVSHDSLVIGSTGGGVSGLITGALYVFVNAIGLRTSCSILGLAVVGGTVVGALVVMAGVLAIKSLEWLYRQLRQKTRASMEVQLQAMGGGAGGVAAAGAAADPEAQRTALERAREERMNLRREMEEYDRLLNVAEERLRQTLPETDRAAIPHQQVVEDDDTQVFQPTPLHITLRLREPLMEDEEEGELTDDDSNDYYIVDGVEGGRANLTPPIY